MTTENAKAPVRQLRLVVEAEDYEAALTFYRDVLGLPEQEAYEGEGDARVTILGAGRATLELSNPAQVKLIDRVESDGQPSARLRVAFEVDDTAAVTADLMKAGAELIATPRITPWQSLNSRLAAPAGLQVTLFQELEPITDRQTGQTSKNPEPLWAVLNAEEIGLAHHFSPKLHQSPAPFSHLVRHGDTAYTAGIIGQSPDDGRLVGPGIEEQCESMFSNLETLLTDVSLSLAHVLRTTIYLTDYDDFQIINAAYARRFPQPFPARTTLHVAGLPLGARVQIDAVVAAGSRFTSPPTA
ncbi:Rid family hydrolase [Pseudarthrobacter sp. RMG13]|uniref:Rid family hydrolase n=1 Tax=Pseudarthrobacter humi TaxID=2952523 RepID=A0ABT1LN01_9MICC|nr:Rid family hydrolase [Pseudarthrobacter humi]MCP8999191.1 Rid family hydrolase [Pseudarthrobacter humi]